MIHERHLVRSRQVCALLKNMIDQHAGCVSDFCRVAQIGRSTLYKFVDGNGDYCSYRTLARLERGIAIYLSDFPRHMRPPRTALTENIEFLMDLEEITSTLNPILRERILDYAISLAELQNEYPEIINIRHKTKPHKY